MTRFLNTTLAAACLLALTGGNAQAQDRCYTELVGKTYTCEISNVDTPTSIATVAMSFSATLTADMNTEFAMYYGALPFACTCMPSGKPGKVKTPEKSTAFSCIKSWQSPIKNDAAIDGKTAGGGSKIVKGRWLSNAPGSDSSVFTCVED
jgi:hypothetical protein